MLTLHVQLFGLKNNISKYNHSRRVFIKKIVGVGIILSLPGVKSCKIADENAILSQRQIDILQSTLSFLWSDNRDVPQIDEQNVLSYFLWMLQDPDVDQEENQYIINGLIWTDETSVEYYERHFNQLNDRERKELLEEIVNSDWGESWMSKVLSWLFEAILSDPIYGSNRNGISWEWLAHNPGQPRPNEKNDYKALLARKKENIVITGI